MCPTAPAKKGKKKASSARKRGQISRAGAERRGHVRSAVNLGKRGKKRLMLPEGGTAGLPRTGEGLFRQNHEKKTLAYREGEKEKKEARSLGEEGV